MNTSFLLRALYPILFFLVAGCASAPSVNQSDDPLYRSQHQYSDTVIGGYNLADLTESPQRNVVMVHFDRPAASIFMPLLTEVNRYDDTITDVSFDHSKSSNPGTFGVGSVRICTFASGKKLVEPLLVYEENRFYAYTVDREQSTRSLPIKDVVLFYSFEDRPGNTSLVTVRAHYKAGNLFLAPLVGTAFGGAINKTFDSAAKEFGGRRINPTKN